MRWRRNGCALDAVTADRILHQLLIRDITFNETAPPNGDRRSGYRARPGDNRAPRGFWRMAANISSAASY
jgi:hypothetical protein